MRATLCDTAVDPLQQQALRYGILSLPNILVGRYAHRHCHFIGLSSRLIPSQQSMGARTGSSNQILPTSFLGKPIWLHHRISGGDPVALRLID